MHTGQKLTYATANEVRTRLGGNLSTNGRHGYVNMHNIDETISIKRVH